MIDKHVTSGAIDLESDQRRSSRRHAHRLHAGQSRGAEPATLVDVVEYRPDYVKRRRRVRPADAKEYAHGLAHARAQGVAARERTDGTIECEIFRPLR